MKKSLYIVAAVFMLLAQGCVMYSDKDEIENAQVDVSDLMYFNYVSPVISMAELADFFDRYQDIRTDRDQAEALARSYFGEYFNPQNLFYEEFAVHPYWGKIAVTETDGQYLVYPSVVRGGIQTVYTVKALGGRCYELSCDATGSHDDSWRSLVSESMIRCGDDGLIRVDAMHIVYKENSEGKEVTVEMDSSDGSMAARMCCDDIYDRYPVSGTLGFNISGYVTDAFVISFHEYGYDIVAE